VKSLLFWSASALLIFGEVMILRAWWSGRTPAAGMRRPRASEFAWIAIPVLVLGATLALTWRAQRTEPQPNEPAHVHPEAS
jgi:type VI protein secretion system component VasK